MEMEAEAQALAQVWNHAFGFIKTSVIKCAIELQIPDIVDKHGGAAALSDISSAAGCHLDLLHRLMRFLTYHGIFKETKPNNNENENDDISSFRYVQTPVSRLMMKGNMGPFVMLQGIPRSPSACMTAEILRTRRRGEDSSGVDGLYDCPSFTLEAFREAMASHARLTTSLVIEKYGEEGFEGVGSLVDVGGSYGEAIGMLVEAFPRLRGIVLDRPEVVARAPPLERVEFVAGNMFESVPKADAVLLMWVLHNCGDKECIQVLKKCKEAIPADTGKVIIVEGILVLDENEKRDEFVGARLLLDMAMMSVTLEGKERTYKEWTHILKEAGFKKLVIKKIKTIESIIEAYP